MFGAGARSDHRGSLVASVWRRTAITPRVALGLVVLLVASTVLAIWAVYGFRYTPSGLPQWTFHLDEEPPAIQAAPVTARIVGWIDTLHLLRNAFVGDADAALVTLRHAVDLDGANVAAHANLAIVLLERGQIAEASQRAFAAVSLAPDNPAVRLLYGRALKLEGRPRAAGRVPPSVGIGSHRARHGSLLSSALEAVSR